MTVHIRPVVEVDSSNEDLGQIIPQIIDSEGHIPIELIHYLLLAHEAYSIMKHSEAFIREAERLSDQKGLKNEGLHRGGRGLTLKPEQYPILIVRSLILLQKNLEILLDPSAKQMQGTLQDHDIPKQTDLSIPIEENDPILNEKNIFQSDEKSIPEREELQDKRSKELQKLSKKLIASMKGSSTQVDLKTLKPLFFQLHQLVMFSDILKKTVHPNLQKNETFKKIAQQFKDFLQHLHQSPTSISVTQLKTLLLSLHKELELSTPSTKMNPILSKSSIIPPNQIKGESITTKPSHLSMQPELRSALMNLLAKSSIPLEARQIQNIIAKLQLAFIVPYQNISPFELRKKSKKSRFETPDQAWKTEEECDEDPCEK